MQRFLTLAACLAWLLLAVMPARVAAATPARIAPSHPLVGVWQFALPDGSCTETYLIRADGTITVQSGEEHSESAFEISAAPSAKGYYKWTDRVVRNNGKPDCGGSRTPIGTQSTLYVRMNPDNDVMILCADESLNRCIGPLVRMEGEKL